MYARTDFVTAALLLSAKIATADGSCKRSTSAAVNTRLGWYHRLLDVCRWTLSDEERVKKREGVREGRSNNIWWTFVSSFCYIFIFIKNVIIAFKKKIYLSINIIFKLFNCTVLIEKTKMQLNVTSCYNIIN